MKEVYICKKRGHGKYIDIFIIHEDNTVYFYPSCSKKGTKLSITNNPNEPYWENVERNWAGNKANVSLEKIRKLLPIEAWLLLAD